MRYSVSIVVNCPREKLISLVHDASRYQEWQPTLVSCEHIEGEVRQVGCKHRLVQKMGSKEVTMVETIHSLQLPQRSVVHYQAKKVWNEVVNNFVAEGEKTRWTMTSEFQCQGMMRFLSAMLPGVFKKESQKHLERFKEFAESQH